MTEIWSEYGRAIILLVLLAAGGGIAGPRNRDR